LVGGLLHLKLGEKNKMVKKGVPKRDGSGRGVRANRGRGGCKETRKTGRGRNVNNTPFQF
jgi:hypothetical protein